MKKNLLISLASVMLVSGCALNNPDAKGFSEVFNEIWDSYEITVDESGYPSMNYQMSFEASSPTYPVIEAVMKFSGQNAYLYTHIDYAPEDDATTFFSYDIEGYADYEEGKFYYELINYDTPIGETALVETGSDLRVIDMDEEGQFSFDIAADIRDQINETVIPTLGNATVIDLLIGKKVPVDEVYTFSLALNNMINFSFAEPYLGAVPASPRLTMSFNRETLETVLGLSYSLESVDYAATITLSDIDQITSDETTLTAAEKASYSVE